jgi:hypothetical protein
MANTFNPHGFAPVNIDGVLADKGVILAAQVTRQGDTLYRNTSGLLTGDRSATGSNVYPIVGTQQGDIIDKDTGETKLTAETGDFVNFIPARGVVFRGQIGRSTAWTAIIPYTAKTATSCYDVAGDKGSQYIDLGASTYDEIKPLKLSHDEVTGDASAVAVSANVEFVFNPEKVEGTCPS